MLHIKKDLILTDIFNSIDEYVKFLENPSNEKSDRRNSSKDKDNSFTGTKSYEEAIELLKYGDDETLKIIKQNSREMKIDKLIGNNINKKETYYNVVGYQPCVPLYLNGVPTCMICEKKNKSDLRVLNIFLNYCVNANITAKELQRIGTIHAIILDVLEKKGYRINLYVGQVSCCNNYGYRNDTETIMPIIKVKTDKEPLNLKKLAFTIAHPSMLRRIGFKYTEVCDSTYDFTHCGYGITETNEKTVKKILKERLKADFIVFNYQTLDRDFTIKKLVKKLHKQGIHIKLEESEMN